jgi:hypothetical protein
MIDDAGVATLRLASFRDSSERARSSCHSALRSSATAGLKQPSDALRIEMRPGSGIRLETRPYSGTRACGDGSWIADHENVWDVIGCRGNCHRGLCDIDWAPPSSTSLKAASKGYEVESSPSLFPAV